MTDEDQPDVQGIDGELIDRLITLLDDAPSAEPSWWGNFGSIAAMALGGIAKVPFDPDRPFKEGSVGAESVRFHGGATRVEYMELLRDRARHLVSQGIDEAFLVRSVRDELIRWTSRMADTEHVNERRAETRDDLRRRAEDRAEIARFRQAMAEQDPQYGELSDDEVRDRLLDMAAKSHLDSLGAEDVTNQWAVQQRLEERARALIGDDVADAWQMRNVFRGR